MSLLVGLKRLLRYRYLQLLRLKSSSHSLALGLALGAYVGCLPALPALPLQTLLALALACVFRVSKLAALLGTLVSNPFNWIIFYWAQYKIGTLIIPMDFRIDPLSVQINDLVSLGLKGVAVLIVGGAILGIPVGLLTYAVSLPLIRSYRKRRALRMLRKRTSPS